MMLRHGQDSTRNQWLNLDGGNTYRGVTTIGSTDDIIEHNSAYMADNSEMGWGWYVFALPQLSWGCTPPPGFSSTHNVWILDNAVTSQPSGDCGYQGVTALQNYMSDPNPVAPRFVGNVLGVPSDEQVQHWTACNESVQGLQFNSQGQLTNFAYEQCTTDGLPAGYNPGQQPYRRTNIALVASAAGAISACEAFSVFTAGSVPGAGSDIARKVRSLCARSSVQTIGYWAVMVCTTGAGVA